MDNRIEDNTLVFRGIAAGICLSLPLWAILIAAARGAL